ncbi:MAG: ABC transporter ATP-binding protein [Clostridia bacterium]|nr:ABC transporter ATP-binding protein [Clostridia bacterium]MBQ7913693.1 ABC transporter ATP-binding protein [Clostridia bacterium]
MPSTQTLLSIKSLKKHFPLPKKSLFSRHRPYLRAVEEVSLDIKKGETFGLVGESGCGKSTFGRTILQLYKPTSGSVVYHGREGEEIDITALKGKDLRALRRELQIIFQDPYSSLNPRMTVGQIIEEGVAAHKFYKKGSPQMQAYLAEIMQKCGLQPYMLNRYPHQFSGGQRQRVCIARALAVKPKFVVCDECVSALDLSVQSQILNLLNDLKEKEGLTYLFISHDLSVVRYISQRLAVMYLGKIVEMGEAEEVFSRPLHPYTVALISAIPSMETEKGEQPPQKILLSGNMPSAANPPTGCPFHTRCFMAQECCQRVPVPLKEVEPGRFVACHFAEISTEEKRKIALKNGNVKTE